LYEHAYIAATVGG